MDCGIDAVLLRIPSGFNGCEGETLSFFRSFTLSCACNTFVVLLCGLVAVFLH
jgi:hypothetical protein